MEWLIASTRNVPAVKAVNQSGGAPDSHGGAFGCVNRMQGCTPPFPRPAHNRSADPVRGRWPRWWAHFEQQHLRCSLLSALMRGTAAVAPRADGRDSGVRLAELMAALSIATDLGMGQPLETALSTCIVAMRLGTTLGLDDDAMRDIYYQSLLRFIGCNAETHLLAALVGDELALRRDFAPIDPGNPPEMIDLVIRYIRQANAAEARARVEEIVARGLLTLPELTRDSFAGHCEVAQRLAQRMELPESLITCLGSALRALGWARPAQRSAG